MFGSGSAGRTIVGTSGTEHEVAGVSPGTRGAEQLHVVDRTADGPAIRIHASVIEAAPPKALKALATELIDRDLGISWWGNIRFEKSFTPELCQQLADSGCIAISGGLEVASDRLLKLMKKETFWSVVVLKLL